MVRCATKPRERPKEEVRMVGRLRSRPTWVRSRPQLMIKPSHMQVMTRAGLEDRYLGHFRLVKIDLLCASVMGHTNNHPLRFDERDAACFISTISGIHCT